MRENAPDVLTPPVPAPVPHLHAASWDEQLAHLTVGGIIAASPAVVAEAARLTAIRELVALEWAILPLSAMGGLAAGFHSAKRLARNDGEGLVLGLYAGGIGILLVALLQLAIVAFVGVLAMEPRLFLASFGIGLAVSGSIGGLVGARARKKELAKKQSNPGRSM